MAPLQLITPDNITFIITIISFIIPLGATAVVTLYQRIKHNEENFIRCTSDLHADNEIKQITSAILLRSFISMKAYTKKTINVIVALLRVLPNGSLQKTLADGLSETCDAKGHDFQDMNLHNVLIKPKTYIRFEIENNRKELEKRLLFTGTDFYKSDIGAGCINSVNFDGAIFNEAILTGTTFRNCTFRKAKFSLTDLNNTKFIDCELAGAEFDKAKRLSKAYVITADHIKENEKDPEKKKSLINFLDSSGTFTSWQEKRKYREKKKNNKIFVSRLGAMDSKQQINFDNILRQISKTCKGIEFIYIKREDYRDSGQLTMIKDAMSQCSGAIIMAFSYLRVENGIIHENLSETDREKATDFSFSSPWIQIETAFASSNNLPCLIITEDNLKCNGIFDDKIIKNDDLMLKMEYKGNITGENESTIKQWWRKVENFS